VRVFRDAVVPVLSAYLVLASVVVYATRHPHAGGTQAGGPRAGGFRWRPRLALIAVTVGGGYVVFLAIVLVFHVWLVGQHGAMRSALKGGTFLAVVSAGAFVALSTVESRRGC
jgi:uncharacterized membrane protein